MCLCTTRMHSRSGFFIIVKVGTVCATKQKHIYSIIYKLYWSKWYFQPFSWNWRNSPWLFLRIEWLHWLTQIYQWTCHFISHLSTYIKIKLFFFTLLINISCCTLETTFDFFLYMNAMNMLHDLECRRIADTWSLAMRQEKKSLCYQYEN